MSKKVSFILLLVVSQLFVSSIYAQTVGAIATPIKGTEDLQKEKEREKEREKEKSKVEPIVSPERTIPGIVNVHSVGIGLGQTFLLGDFADHGDDKITADLLYSYSASYSIDFLLDLHRSKHTYQDKSVTIPGLAAGVKGKFYQFDSFAPFMVAGLGFYRPKMRRLISGQYVDSDGKIVFGTNVGGGIDLRLNRNYIIGFLAQLHNPFDVKQDIGSKVEGSYFKLMITAMYSF